jgi:MSHA biogenesis protein MshP
MSFPSIRQPGRVRRSLCTWSGGNVAGTVRNALRFSPYVLPDRGFVLPSAVFLLVILAALAAFLVTISTTQNVTSAQDVQGARAYQAARAGIEWGLYPVLDPLNTSVVAPGNAAWPNMPGCPAGVLAIEGFSVTVGCVPAVPQDYLEGGNSRSIRVYHLVSTASIGAVGAANHVEREIQVTVSKCRARDGAAPDYACP